LVVLKPRTDTNHAIAYGIVPFAGGTRGHLWAAPPLSRKPTRPPTPFCYRYGFSRENGATVVQVGAVAELGGAADFLAPLVRRALQKGVDDNLATLKTILETLVTSDGFKEGHDD
jgi:hypothetical protein